MILTQDLGDATTHIIPLRWSGRPFVPGTAWSLVFTVKLSADLPDSARLFQKAYPAQGITVSNSTASVSVLRADTFREAGFPTVGSPAFEAAAGEYVWDIQANEISGAFRTRTVARGTLTLGRDITRLSQPTAPVYVVANPLTVMKGINVTVSETPPLSPTSGDLWRDTSDNSLSIWDAVESAWIVTSGTSRPPETTASIIDKIKGAVASPTKIGAEYLPPDWLQGDYTSPAPGGFDTSVQPNDLWWGRVVDCDYPISMPFDIPTSLGKKFIVRSTVEVQLSGAYVMDSNLFSIPAPTQLFGSTLTLFEFIGNVWRATLRYTGRPITSASSLAFTPAGNLASVNVQTALQELDAEKAPLASPVFTGSITANSGTWNGSSFTGNQTFDQNVSVTGTLAVDTTIAANVSITAPTVTGTTLRSITLQALNTAGIDIKDSVGNSTFKTGINGSYNAEFGTTGIDRSFVAKVKGAFGWFRGVFTGRIHPPDTLTADRTWTLPDASGFVALTSNIPAAPTATSIAAALNAGTQDTVAADTDQIAVTSPAGGWMLLSTLWTWVTGKINTLAKLDAIVADATLARTDAGQNFTGNQAINGTLGVTAGITASIYRSLNLFSLDFRTSADVSMLRIGASNGGVALGVGSVASHSLSFASGDSTTASGIAAHAEGTLSTASGDYSHAAGRRSKATHQGSRVLSDSQDADVNSSAINEFTFRFANGYRFLGGAATFSGAATVSGLLTSTNNQAASTAGIEIKMQTGESLFRVNVNGGGVAAGPGSIASNKFSFASGDNTLASGLVSYADGAASVASGDYSNASGRQVKATHMGSRVIGDGQAVDTFSSAINEFTARFAGGYRFLGGAATFTGKMSALIPAYATDMAADADATLLSGQLYKITGLRTVYQKP